MRALSAFGICCAHITSSWHSIHLELLLEDLFSTHCSIAERSHFSNSFALTLQLFPRGPRHRFKCCGASSTYPDRGTRSALGLVRCRLGWYDVEFLGSVLRWRHGHLLTSRGCRHRDDSRPTWSWRSWSVWSGCCRLRTGFYPHQSSWWWILRRGVLSSLAYTTWTSPAGTWVGWALQTKTSERGPQ